MAVLIEILSNVRCRMSLAPRETLRLLDDALCEVQKGSEWAPTHRRFGGRWDGKKHHFYVSPTTPGVGTFPKGLLHRVRGLLDAHKVEHKLRDLRKRILPAPDLSAVHADMLHGVSMSGMYAHQLEAVNAALKAQCGILYMATNAGKTEIASAIIRALSGIQILVVVPSKQLLKDTQARIASRLGTIPENLGTIGGGKWDPREITVAIINSITPMKRANSAAARLRNDKMRSYLASVDCVILDEGHHAKAATWVRLTNALINAQFRFLMSGTPFTGDNDLLIEAGTGPVIYEIRNKELMDLGVSARPTIHLITIDKPNLQEELEDQSWPAVYEAGIVHNVYRNKLIAKYAKEAAAQSKSVLVLINRLAQGNNIRQLIESKDRWRDRVDFAHGKMPDSQRESIKAWFVEKPGRILIGSRIYDEGVDMPAINTLIIGDGLKSLRKTLQQVGRSIRRKTGENVVDVIDFADCTHKFLSSHSLDRYDIYNGESFEVVEEPPKAKNGRSSNQIQSEEPVSTLPRQALSRSELYGEGERSVRHASGSDDQGAHAIRESSHVMHWRWRQITRLDRGAIRHV